MEDVERGEIESLNKEIYMIESHGICLKQKVLSDYIFVIL